MLIVTCQSEPCGVRRPEFDRRGVCVRISSRRQVAFAAFVLLAGPALSGCASTIADLPLVGLPANAPERPKEARGFLPVNDVPQKDREGKITSAEQQKIQAELIAARSRSAAAAAAK